MKNEVSEAMRAPHVHSLSCAMHTCRITFSSDSRISASTVFGEALIIPFPRISSFGQPLSGRRQTRTPSFWIFSVHPLPLLARSSTSAR